MRVKIVSASGLLPKYQTIGAAGMDIAAYLSENIVIESGETVSIQTGLRMEIPIDYEFQLRSRSGLSLKGIVVANSPATIDSDFRGEIKILLHNASKEPFIIENGMRIAQGVFAAYERVVFEQVEISDLSTTERGQKGFGSTGVSSKQELKVGTKLIAKTEFKGGKYDWYNAKGKFVASSETSALIIGKEYEVLAIDLEKLLFYINSEVLENHALYIGNLEYYFEFK